MRAYFDTSAFVKLLLDEPGHDRARALWRDADRASSSILLYPEARAALAQANRRGRFEIDGAELARLKLEVRWALVVAIACGSGIARHAGDLAEEDALRGDDAVHLATALALDDPDLLFVTWDEVLATAARRHGLAVAP